MLSDEERKEFITTAFVHRGSALTGRTLREAGQSILSRGTRVLEIIRNEVALEGDPRDVVLEMGDRMVIALRPGGLSRTRGSGVVDVGLEEGLGLETIAAHEGSIVEGVVAPRSSLIGQAIGQIQFRQRYRMIVLAIHRRGINLRKGFENVPLAFGDALLMMGTDEAREALRHSDDILLLDRPGTPSKPRRGTMVIILVTLLGVVLTASMGLLPVVVSALLGCGVLMGTGCIKPKQAYASIDWGILILIYGMLALGMAMEDSGAARMLAARVMDASAMIDSPQTRAMLVLAGVYIITSALTEVMSNNASIVLMAPIALDIALTLGVDPRPFVIATTVAASASFSTPIGYQTNTYVYGVGNYRFGDFIRVGLPLNFVYFFTCMLVVPLVWPL
jgi:di/tricarboxylate transporter